MALLHQEVREFQTIAAMRAIEVLPQDNDKFFCEETNLMYDYDAALTDVDDSRLVLALDSFPGRFQAVSGACPTNVVDYNDHSFIGRKIGKNVQGYVLPLLTFPETYETSLTDAGGSAGNSITYTAISFLIDELNAEAASLGNSTLYAAGVTLSGDPVIYVTNAVSNNIQLYIRNSTTGVWVTGNGVLDPESDGVNGQKPYSVTIQTLNNGEDCEIVKVTAGTFNCATDEVLFRKIGGFNIPANYIPYDFGTTINGAFNPSTNASNLFIHTFYQFQAGVSGSSIDMVALTMPFGSGTSVGISALDVTQIQAALNILLPTIGFAANDVIYTVLNSGELALWVSPAFAANIPSGDFFQMYAGSTSAPGTYTAKVEFTNPIGITQGDIQLPVLGAGSGLYFGKVGCPQGAIIPKPILSIQAWQEPQHFRNTGGSPPSANSNKIKLNIRYPEGFPDFETLVATGKVRLQLEHMDGRTYIKHKAKGIKVRQTIVPRLCIHRNGSLDAGDYLFGGDCRDTGNNVYPNRDTMLYLPTTLLPNQFVEFEIDPSLWYGYGGAANCGVISTMLPMKYEDYLTSEFTTLCGHSRKSNFSSRPMEKNDRIYFRFIFMYKNANGRWERSIAPSDQFFVDFKIANTDAPGGEVQRWIIGWRARMA